MKIEINDDEAKFLMHMVNLGKLIINDSLRPDLQRYGAIARKIMRTYLLEQGMSTISERELDRFEEILNRESEHMIDDYHVHALPYVLARTIANVKFPTKKEDNFAEINLIVQEYIESILENKGISVLRIDYPELEAELNVKIDSMYRDEIKRNLYV